MGLSSTGLIGTITMPPVRMASLSKSILRPNSALAGATPFPNIVGFYTDKATGFTHASWTLSAFNQQSTTPQVFRRRSQRQCKISSASITLEGGGVLDG